MKQMILLPILFVSCLSFTACSKSGKSKAPTRTQIVVLGDPLKIVNGATLSADFSKDTFQDGETLFLLTTVSFEEQGEYVPGQRPDIEAQNKTAGRETAKKSNAEDYAFSVRIRSADNIAFENRNDGFEFVKQAQGIQAIAVNEKNSEAQLLHTSISADKNTVSFLVYSRNKSTLKRTLTALYFARDPHANLVKTDKPFEYIRGTGVKMPWPKKSTVEVNLCNSDSLLKAATKSSLDSWQSVLGHRLTVKYNGSVSSYPPFTDLNYRGVYLVDGYLANPNPEVGNFAVTATVPNMTKSEITDSDVLIFQNEFKKYRFTSLDVFNQYLTRVVLHELGHFFGLGHQFNGVASIMSYASKGAPQIEQHDIEAIEELYK